MSCENKVGLVTGGARRLGRAICLGLHREGYRTIIHCNISTKEANELKEEMNRTRKDSAEVVCGDFSTNVAETSKEIVEKAVAKWGRLDLVVNNASNFIMTSLHDVTSDNWDSSMDVNLKAPVFMMQAAAKYLKERNGSIVNITDLIGLKPKETHFSHSISKAGLISATLSAALVLAPEVRVNTIAPGCILWPEVDPQHFDKKEEQKWLTSTPLRKSGTPEDVAEAVLFLSSPSASFITGQILKLDGGRGLVF